jgi:hypothetical protein
VSIYRGDHVWIHTKDDQYFTITVTEINSKRQSITGRPYGISKDAEYEPIVVNFSAIREIQYRGESVYWHDRVIWGHRDNWFLTLLGLVVLAAL